MTAEEGGKITIDPSTGYTSISGKFETGGDLELNGDISNNNGYWVDGIDSNSLSKTLEEIYAPISSGAVANMISSNVFTSSGYFYYNQNGFSFNGAISATRADLEDVTNADTWDGTNISLASTISNIISRLEALES